MNEKIFNRAYRLLGTPAMEVLATKRVIVFGVGGVGSWCAESLVRTGIRHITLVDSDSVCETNINRQLMATTETVGQVKVEALKARLLTINPEADIQTKHCFYNAETAPEFNLSAYDYVVDAIDSLQDKALLLLNATRSSARVFSSMGAALKLDPTRIQVAEFWQVKGCPLGAALRRKFKKQQQFPSRKFKCVFSDELLTNLGTTDEPLGYKAQINGSLAHITAIFGFTLAGLIIEHIVKRAHEAANAAHSQTATPK